MLSSIRRLLAVVCGWAAHDVSLRDMTLLRPDLEVISVCGDFLSGTSKRDEVLTDPYDCSSPAPRINPQQLRSLDALETQAEGWLSPGI